MRITIVVTSWMIMVWVSLTGGPNLLLTASDEARSGKPDLGYRSPDQSGAASTNPAPPISATDEMDVPMPDIVEGVEVIGWGVAYDRTTGELVCWITLWNKGDLLLSQVEWEMTREITGHRPHDTSITCRTVRQIGAGETVTASVRLRARLRPCGQGDIETLGVGAVRALRVYYYC